MQAVEIYKFFAMFVSLFLAYWSGKEIVRFPYRINWQVYQDFQSLVAIPFLFNEFQRQSSLQPKQTKLPYLFYVFFPIIIYGNGSLIISGILIILCFLSMLDYYYYFTDIRYIAIIFTLTLLENNVYLNSLFFTICFFVIIHLFSRFILKKEGFGLGDSLLLCALSPLFDLQKMLLLILIAALLGILFYLGYLWFKKQKLEKLPFVPFIAIAFFSLIY